VNFLEADILNRTVLLADLLESLLGNTLLEPLDEKTLEVL
jgi:hypothetical protein